jgi:hypothetical protein
MCELPDHLPTRAVLNKQRVLAADLRTSRDVGDLDKQGGAIDVDGRSATVDHALSRMNLGRGQPHFVGEVVSRLGDPRENFAHFRFVVDES